MQLTCFKAYDIRGRLGSELNDEIVYRIGRAYAQFLGARRIVIGGDVRLTSAALKQALARGLMDAGADVIDIGVTGTEEIYFAAFHLDVDGGIEITASHNPMDYNGMKLVARGARPISGDSGLREIQALAERGQFASLSRIGTLSIRSIVDDYVTHLLGYVDPAHFKPLKLVVNAGNGAAGHVVDAIEARLKGVAPIECIKIRHEPDGHFPNGIPNPLLPENRQATADAVRQNHADMGIAWDGDFDRCFLYDERGEFIEGYYIVGLLAQSFLQKHPGERIIHDPRLVWNTVDIVKNAGGIPIESKTGHAFIKERMRKENAIYGGEMSAHHYFRDFAYCDSGMIPWLLVAELMSRSNQKLSDMVEARINKFPCSGEINFTVKDVPTVLNRIEQAYKPHARAIDHIDGVSMDMGDWRFNVRASNTEPLLRLNVETRETRHLLGSSVAALTNLILTPEQAVRAQLT